MREILTKHKLYQSFRAVRRIDVIHVIGETRGWVRKLPLRLKERVNQIRKQLRHLGSQGAAQAGIGLTCRISSTSERSRSSVSASRSSG